MGGSSKKVTVGYKYYAGLHLVLCHGPVDAITEIRVGERVAWTGNVTASGNIDLAKPALFGGEEREGGVQGRVNVAMGEAAQGVNGYLDNRFAGNIPAFRGVAALIARQVYLAANNPYIKPWAVVARRIPASWYAAKATINTDDANPALILYELLTNTSWGLGYSSGDLDLTSFTAAADTLYTEGFGLSFLWGDQQPIEAFIDEVLRHIEGALYVHPRTGLFTLKLVRDDYTVASLPVFDPSNVIEVENLTRVGWSDRINQLSVVFLERAKNREETITVQDIAAIEMQGGAIASTTVRYPGVATAALANKLAARDLRRTSAGLMTCTLVVNRAGATLNIGDVAVLDWPDYGIAQMVLRVLSTDYGTLQDGRVRLECVEDIFSAADSLFSDPPETGWVDPATLPAPCPYRKVVEAPYWTVVRELSGESDTALSELANNPDNGWLCAMGTRPSGDALNFAVWTRQGTAAYAEAAKGDFCPTGTLAAAVGLTDTLLTLVDDADSLDLLEIGAYVYLENECVGIDAVNADLFQITVKRGVLDTVPVAHAIGARLFAAEHWQGLIETEYLSGEVVDVKLLPTTTYGTLAEASATADTLTFNRRMIRPYPPGNVQVNGAAYPSVMAGALAVTWAHRDRTLQTAALIPQTDGNIGPEAGTTYTVKIYGESGGLVHTETGLTGTSYTYPTATEISESGAQGRLHRHLRVTLESARSGYASWQAQDFQFDRAGYGLNYGLYYGMGV